MRVLHVVCTDAFAGVERSITNLAVAQQAGRAEVTVVGGATGPMRAFLGNSGVAHVPAPTLLGAVRAVNRYSRGCQVIHVHMTAAEAVAAIAPAARGIPLVATRHFAAHRGSSRVGRIIAPWVASRLSAQIAVSHYTAGLVDGPSTVVHPGVPTCASRREARSRRPVVLVAQRLEPEKDTHLALYAFAASKLAEQGWRLHIAGDGARRADLERLAAHLGMSQFTEFLGHREDMDDLMAGAGLLMAPRPDEAFGLSVLEAMAAGLTVVAAGSGGHLETVGVVPDAALFPPGDADAAGAVLAGLGRDPQKRDAYAAALQQVQRTAFTLEAQERATDAVYRSVL